MRAALFLIALIAVGCQPDPAAPQPKAGRPGGPVAPPRPADEDLTDALPQYRYTADDFRREWKADEKLATGRYLGRVVALTGEIQSVGRAHGKSHVTLQAAGAPHGIECATAEERPWSKVVPGQRVTIKGVCRWDAPTGVGLNNGVFEEVGVFASDPVTAAAFAKECAADAAGAAKKYQARWLVVSGEVAALESGATGTAVAVLKTDAAVKLTCVFAAGTNDLTKPLKPGQPIKAVGRATITTGTIELRDALPLR